MLAPAELVAIVSERKRPHFFYVASKQEDPHDIKPPAEIFLDTSGSFLLETSGSMAEKDDVFFPCGIFI